MRERARSERPRFLSSHPALQSVFFHYSYGRQYWQHSSDSSPQFRLPRFLCGRFAPTDVSRPRDLGSVHIAQFKSFAAIRARVAHWQKHPIKNIQCPITAVTVDVDFKFPIRRRIHVNSRPRKSKYNNATTLQSSSGLSLAILSCPATGNMETTLEYRDLPLFAMQKNVGPGGFSEWV